MIYRAGELEGKMSDGDRRRYEPESAALIDHATGRGHRARVVSDEDVAAIVVHLPVGP